jgi:hypothetical protein
VHAIEWADGAKIRLISIRHTATFTLVGLDRGTLDFGNLVHNQMVTWRS